jgi:hypothetical protein
MDLINNESNNEQEFFNSFAWTKHNASWAWDGITSSREVFANYVFKKLMLYAYFKNSYQLFL